MLMLPAEQRIPWLRKRVARVGELLTPGSRPPARAEPLTCSLRA
ncbi:MAG: hypothetical protein ACRDSL_04510 [Pseudonocardiaceae bacterium]